MAPIPNRAEAFNAALLFRMSKAHLQLHLAALRVHSIRFRMLDSVRWRTYIGRFLSIVRADTGGSRSGSCPSKRHAERHLRRIERRRVAAGGGVFDAGDDPQMTGPVVFHGGCQH